MKLTAQINLFSKVSFQEKLMFTKHLDTMVSAGIPIVEALGTVVDQSKSAKFKEILAKVLADIKNGQSLAKTLAKYPEVFDDLYISLIKVGEESGTLEENLSFLSKQMTKDFRLRKKVRSAMIYPAIVIFAMSIMSIFVSLFVLPKLVDFFSSFDVDLPLMTKILLFIANLMKNYGIYIFLGVAVFVIILRIVTRLTAIRPKWHALLLRTPGVGKLISCGQLSHFARNFGTLIKSGVPVSKSLEITAATLTNLKFRNDLLSVSKSLNKGKNIGDSLAKRAYFEYPPLVSKMVSVGEKTGKLDETLLYLGNFYEDEVDDLSKNLSTVIEPILLIIIGIGVAFLAVAIISPIYELTGSIRR
jgi:type IV pilus assembly protein PilC